MSDDNAFAAMLAQIEAEATKRAAYDASPEGQAEAARHAKREADRAAALERKARDGRIKNITATGVNLRADEAARIVDGDYQSTEAVALVERWLPIGRYGCVDDRARPWDTLALLGERGVGKTWAAGVAIHRVVNAAAGGAAAYAKVRRLCGIFRASWGDDAAAWDDAMRASLLVVDELGTGRDRDLERDMLQELVDERHCRGRSTLLISNLGWSTRGERKGLDQVFDARTIDRLNDGRAKSSLLTGMSLRGRVANGPT